MAPEYSLCARRQTSDVTDMSKTMEAALAADGSGNGAGSCAHLAGRLGFLGLQGALERRGTRRLGQLEKGPVQRDELVTQLGLNRRSAQDFLDALVASGFLEREGIGATASYTNTLDTATFLARGARTI